MMGAIVGCGAKEDGTASIVGDTTESTQEAAADSISVVTTIFPEYDWVKQIVGDSDSVEVTMLLDNGVDLHNYQPSADDIMKVATCDVFIYVGGESDEWVDDALQEATNKDMVAEQDLDYDTTIKDNKFGHRRPTDKSAVEASYDFDEALKLVGDYEGFII